MVIGRCNVSLVVPFQQPSIQPEILSLFFFFFFWPQRVVVEWPQGNFYVVSS
jgi:hypothetical protein